MATTKRKSKTPGPTSADVVVFVPCGQVTQSEILRAALMGVRDQIPIAAMDVSPKVVSASEVKTGDDGKTEGRDYTVTITWTPRRVGATTAEEQDEAPGTVDKTLEALEPLTAAKIAAVTDVSPEA